MRSAYEPETKVKSVNKRDTKRWCKGVPGREHVAEWKFLPPWDDDPATYWKRWQTSVCTVCGKHLASRMVGQDGKPL